MPSGRVGGGARRRRSGVGGFLGGLFRDSGMPIGAIDVSEVELGLNRALEQHQLMEVVTDILQQATPDIIQAMTQEVQDRAARGLPEEIDDEALERGWVFLASVVSEAVVKYAPNAIKKATKSLGALIGSRDVDAYTPLLVDTETNERFFLPSLSSILCAVQTCLPQLYAAVSNPTREMPRDTGISWNDLMRTKRFWDNDNIAVISTEPIDDSNAIEFVLELAPHKVWWKGLQVLDDNGSLVSEIGVEGQNKIASTRVPAQQLLDPGGYLVFMKAKMFGIHTVMYRLPTAGLNELRGKKVHLYWYAD